MCSTSSTIFRRIWFSKKQKGLVCTDKSFEMAELKEIEWSEIEQHKSMSSCWFVVDGIVYDVTEFLFEHPGGEEVLIEHGGKDAAKEFKRKGFL